MFSSHRTKFYSLSGSGLVQEPAGEVAEARAASAAEHRLREGVRTAVQRSDAAVPRGQPRLLRLPGLQQLGRQGALALPLQEFRLGSQHSAHAQPIQVSLVCPLSSQLSNISQMHRYLLSTCWTACNPVSVFSMSTMGFNMGSMNSSSIMPSVTSISPSLNTSSVPYGSQHSVPSTTVSYPYKDSMSVYKDSMSATYPGMTSSIASLRLKAKQHQVAGFSSYSPQPPPLSPRSSCQYGGTPERPLI